MLSGCTREFSPMHPADSYCSGQPAEFSKHPQQPHPSLSGEAIASGACLLTSQQACGTMVQGSLCSPCTSFSRCKREPAHCYSTGQPKRWSSLPSSCPRKRPLQRQVLGSVEAAAEGQALPSMLCSRHCTSGPHNEQLRTTCVAWAAPFSCSQPQPIQAAPAPPSSTDARHTLHGERQT